jgi:uroporphyrinogen-III synthase
MKTPLAGRTLVVTRAADQAPELIRQLTDLGATVVALPVSNIEDPADGGAALKAALTQATQYDWIIATSPNGAQRLARALTDLPAHTHLAAVGPQTAKQLTDAGWPVDFVPQSFVADALVAEFPTGPGRALWVRAETARPTLADGLRAKGWEVEQIVAYRNTETPVDPTVLATAQSADAVLFTSASSVERYRKLSAQPQPAVALCLGPVTADAAQKYGFETHQADEFSLSGLLDLAQQWATG